VLDQAQTVPSQDFRLAVPVAMVGMLLRESSAKGRASYQVAYDLAKDALGSDPRGERSEYLMLL